MFVNPSQSQVESSHPIFKPEKLMVFVSDLLKIVTENQWYPSPTMPIVLGFVPITTDLTWTKITIPNAGSSGQVNRIFHPNFH